MSFRGYAKESQRPFCHSSGSGNPGIESRIKSGITERKNPESLHKIKKSVACAGFLFFIKN